MNTQIITQNGEITTKEDLIKEIENILNRFDVNAHSKPYHSSIDPHIIQALPIDALISIRDNLLHSDEKALQDFKHSLTKKESSKTPQS